jgi:hypothetical protein
MLALFAACAYLLLGILFYTQAQADDILLRSKVTQSVTQSYGPDIRHCFKPDETRELWDCIRHVEVDDE